MRLAIGPRGQRLFRRLPRYSIYSLAELALLALLAVQCARLFWVIVTPIGPVGDWRPAGGPDLVRARAALTSDFDPFFRLDQSGAQPAVTSLQLKLFGVRVNEATGRGSAILAGPDGVQTSYAVGEAILPGVTLKRVNPDGVVIQRGGTEETLFLDESKAAPAVSPAPTAAPPLTDTSLAAPAPSAAQTSGVTVSALQSGVQMQPRMIEGKVAGFVVRPQGDGSAFAKSGLAPGDVIVQIAGKPVGSAEQLQQALGSAAMGGVLTLMVERGGRQVPLSITISGR